MATFQDAIYNCPNCGKLFKRGLVKCKMVHDPKECCHFGDTEIESNYPVCVRCKVRNTTGPNHKGFFQCRRCGYSTESRFDEIVMEGITKGMDLITGTNMRNIGV